MHPMPHPGMLSFCLEDFPFRVSVNAAKSELARGL